MTYYRHNETGEVFAYEQSDLDAVISIAPLEQALQDAIAALPSNVEDEGYESAKQAVDEAQHALDAINPVFYKIRDNIANCTEMTAAEIEEHLNPTPTQEQLEAAARAQRDRLLHELDAIVSNPLRWNGFSEAEQQALADYHQALLDVPQQEGFPDDIDWPTFPEEGDPNQSFVPSAVSRRQGRLALLNAGKLDDVEAAIDAIEDPAQKRAAQIEFEADTWERSNPFLQQLWVQLGGTEQELDNLFILASTL